MTGIPRVLIVDADGAEQARVSVALGPICELKVATTRRQALKLASSDTFQVLVVGKGFDGSQAALLASMHQVSPESRAVFLVDDTSGDDARRLARLGALVRRDASADRIVAAVRAALRFTAMRADVRRLMHESGQAPSSGRDAAAQTSGREERRAQPARGAQILVVEDDEATRRSLADVLGASGYRVQVVANGLEALKALRSADELPSLVLLDLVMPVMDGPTFLDERRRDPRLAAIPVTVVSGRDGSRAMLERRDVCETVPKPVDLTRLLTAVERTCVGRPAPVM